MRPFALFATVLAALPLFAAAPAKADYFVWQDPKTGASLSFPDTWRTINNQKPDDIVTVLGPSQDDYPVCRLRAREDKRYVVDPVWKSAAVQKLAYSGAFWESYTGEYDNVQVHQYQDGAGLGRAFASMGIASYNLPGYDPSALRTGIMWGGLYYDTAFILDCSSSTKSFADWQPDFLSIAKSVDMRKTHHELVTGNYRNFITGNTVTEPVMSGRKEKIGETFY